MEKNSIICLLLLQPEHPPSLATDVSIFFALRRADVTLRLRALCVNEGIHLFELQKWLAICEAAQFHSKQNQIPEEQTRRTFCVKKHDLKSLGPFQ